MRVKHILLPLKKLITISADDTLGHALQLIEDNGYLSLPVLEGEELLGVLSKQFIFERFFYGEESDRDIYLQRSVRELMVTKLPVIKENALIEQAAEKFFLQKLRFLPVVNEEGKFIGIVTQKEIFKKFVKIFGLRDIRIVVGTFDFKGRLAKLTEVISKSGGNIGSIIQMDTEVMGIQEVVLRIKMEKPDQLPKLLRRLQDNGFLVRDVETEEEQERSK
ncbi:MAG: CBS domain-containing protein [Epulopiscium sp.]|nr:CBS domain-containing protein [Candidatus Epulonipiscium sp.]